MTLISPITIDGYYQYNIVDVKQGGMASVLLLDRVTDASPFDKLHRKQLAAKTFKNEEMTQKELGIFLRELNIWLSLQAVNIVPLLKVVTVARRLLALMPLYAHSLRDVMTLRGPIKESLAAYIVLQCSKCLSQAHSEAGILHLDLKPENILVEQLPTQEYCFHVSDWGIAAICHSTLPRMAGGIQLPDNFLCTMSAFGTLPYMSPERLCHGLVGIQADIYSLGLILVEMVTGILPFSLSDAEGVFEDIATATYFNRAIGMLATARCSTRLHSVVVKSISPNPRDRYHTYDELIYDLGHISSRRWNLF